jgi:predicted nucleotidyltransferase
MATDERRSSKAALRKNMPERWHRELRAITRRIAESFNPKRIILFGSSARSMIGPHSDLDLLIVKNSRLPFHRRAAAAYKALRGIKRSLPVEILVYTERELEARRALGDHFLLEALRQGKVLYDRRPGSPAR